MRKGQKFTPLNIGNLQETCKKYGLIFFNCAWQTTFGGTKKETKTVFSIGVNKECARLYPMIVVYDSGWIRYRIDPEKYMIPSMLKMSSSYMVHCRDSKKHISSVENLVKFLEEQIPRYKKVTDQT